MRITIETIRHENQRYSTVGDWIFLGPDHLLIRVSELGSWRKEAAIAVHELVEALLCRNEGITQAAVDAFDMTYEANRRDDDIGEPGDDPEAPYHRQHCFATGIERMLIAALGVPWADYEQEIERLP